MGLSFILTLEDEARMAMTDNEKRSIRRLADKEGALVSRNASRTFPPILGRTCRLGQELPQPSNPNIPQNNGLSDHLFAFVPTR
jgi:hypothetical protein